MQLNGETKLKSCRSIHDELLSEKVLAAISKGLGTNDIILVPVGYV